MKIKYIIILSYFILFSTNVKGQKVKFQKASFSVSGNCSMCKNKIEFAANSVDGVRNSKWNIDTKKMKIKFNPLLTDISEIQSNIANIGYDTEKYRAEDEVYDKLHYCCKYERKL